jgi:hypothetical protein
MRNARWAIPLLIGIVAFLIRFLAVQASGGLHALLGYDEGVYFGGSTAFVDGLMPYRDFVLVHPPGLLLLLSPFAKLGSLTSNPTGWAFARIFIMAIGAVNAVLVYTVARRVNLTAGIVAGGLYALWSPAIHVERTTMLESIVLLALLVALAALPTARVGIALAILAGAFLGLGTSVKLWGLIPLLVILGWLLISRAWRTAAVVAGAALAVFAVIVMPFAVIARQRMWDLIVLGQLQRGGGGTARDARLIRMGNVDLSFITHHRSLGVFATVVVLILAVSALVLAWRGAPRSRLWVVLLIVQSGVLLAVPVYFDGYSSFIAPALMLVVGTACSIVLIRAHKNVGLVRIVMQVGIFGLVGLSALLGIYRSVIHGERNPATPAAIAAAADVVASAQCVASDSPGLLLLTNTLSHDIARRCAVLIDVDGTIYSIDRGRNPNHLDGIPRRLASTQYQNILTEYFAQADAVMLHRIDADGLTPSSLATVTARPLLLHRRLMDVYGR